LTELHINTVLTSNEAPMSNSATCWEEGWQLCLCDNPTSGQTTASCGQLRCRPLCTVRYLPQR